MILIKRKIYKNLDVLKGMGKLFKRIGAILKLIKDRKVPIHKKAMVLAGLIYVVSPLDIVPDPVLGFGFIDDAVLMMYIISKISDQLDRYIKEDREAGQAYKNKFDQNKIIDNIEYEIEDKK